MADRFKHIIFLVFLFSLVNNSYVSTPFSKAQSETADFNEFNLVNSSEEIFFIESNPKTKIFQDSNSIPHNPIKINGNIDFADQAISRSWPGDGSQKGPFVISNYLITINSAGGKGIEILNTDVHFIIQNITIDSNNRTTRGVWLNNVSHGLIINTTVANEGDGFWLEKSSNNTFINNTASDGIKLYGFYLEQSSNNNTLKNNYVTNSLHGFVLDISNNNKLINNTAFKNILEGFSLYGKIMDDNSYNVLENNTAVFNGKGFYLFNSSFNDLINNTATINVRSGFSLETSDYNTLINNTATDNLENGFSLETSDYNTLIANAASDNEKNGFSLIVSYNNTLINNVAFNNKDRDTLILTAWPDSENVEYISGLIMFVMLGLVTLKRVLIRVKKKY